MNFPLRFANDVWVSRLFANTYSNKQQVDFYNLLLSLIELKSMYANCSNSLLSEFPYAKENKAFQIITILNG